MKLFKKKSNTEEVQNNTNVVKKKKKSKTSLGTKIFVWFMVIAMFGSFVITLLAYLINTK